MTLVKGQRFSLGGRKWRVQYVNASRAHCVATVKAPVRVHDKRSGRDRTFEATRRITLDISPNAAVTVLAELEHEVQPTAPS